MFLVTIISLSELESLNTLSYGSDSAYIFLFLEYGSSLKILPSESVYIEIFYSVNP